MPKPAGKKVAAVTVTAVAAAACTLASACSSPQQPTTTPGTTPSVWTGSPAPSASGRQEATPSPQAGASAQMLMTVLKGPDGAQVATAKFEFTNGYATVTVATSGNGVLSPGFHGMHLHKVGKCEPNSVAPNGGAPGDFLSAGGHLQLPGSTGHASGDLPPLQVRKDGSGMLVTTTDAFTMDDLTSGSKTAIIIHAGADNFANIPADRYKQNDGTPGPDETTMTTGDAGKRVACGVIGSG